MKLKKIIKFYTKADIFLVVVLLIVSIALLLNDIKDSGSKVQIFVKNKLQGEYLLSEPQLISINNDEIIVEIKDEKARLLKSSCKNQLCVKQSWSNSFPVICLPNQIELRFEQKNSNDSIKKIIK